MVYAFSYPFFPELHSIYIAPNPVDWEQLYTEDILVFVEQGHATFQIGQKQYDVGPGDVIYARAGELVKRVAVPRHPFSLYYLHVDVPKENCAVASGQIIDAFFENNKFGERTTNRKALILVEDHMNLGESAESVLYEIRQIWDIMNIYQPGYSYIVNSALQKIFGMLSSEVLQKYSSPHQVLDNYVSTDKRIQGFTDYIYNNVDQRIGLQELCNEFHFSPQYIINLFKKHLNTTPIKYINAVKIMYAKEVMRQKNYSVKQVSEMIGYSNPHYFSKIFKSISGCTPSEYQGKFIKK